MNDYDNQYALKLNMLAKESLSLIFGLLHEYFGWIVGVYKRLKLKSSVSHLVVHATILNKILHIIFEFPYLLDTFI